MKNSNYIPALDGIRAIACILVILTHLTFIEIDISSYPIGSLGVIYFFALSGYLMGKLYFTQQASIPNIKNYIISRISRIAPMYLFFCLICHIIYKYIDSSFIYSLVGPELFRHLLFMGSIDVLWSIPPEVQFYSLFIPLWIMFTSARFNKYLPFLIITLLGIFMTRELWPGIIVFSKLHIFIFGVLVALLPENYFQQSTKNRIMIMQIFSLCAITCCFIAFIRHPEEYNHIAFAAMVAFSIPLLAADTIFSKALLHSQLLRYISQASFTIYLTHSSILFYLNKLYNIIGLHNDALRLIIAFIICIIIGLILYRFIEKPLIKATRKGLSALTTQKPEPQIIS